MADLCKTDLLKIIKYLSDAASLYDAQQGLRYSSRANETGYQTGTHRAFRHHKGFPFHPCSQSRSLRDVHQ